ncbi:MAG: site-specific integrase [Planctomycetes bacterium]|nr:site-specific integrase [Planctomycetota bacterium]
MTWDRVDFEGERVHFANTKGKRDRYVPVTGEVLSMLRRLQAQTLRDGGPFVGMARGMQTAWDDLITEAKVEGITLHDLRRTYVTRLIRAGVPLPTVQKLAGHSSIQTTLRYYNWVSDDDMRDGVAKLKAMVG